MSWWSTVHPFLKHACTNASKQVLSFHQVREGIAAGIAKFHHVQIAQNPTNILSKQWLHASAWPLQPLLFWEGDTLDLIEDEPDSSPRAEERGMKQV
jgi:hypothetical protein